MRGRGTETDQEKSCLLQGHEISPAYAVKIFKVYRDKAVSVVKENPYRLALDIQRYRIQDGGQELRGAWE